MAAIDHTTLLWASGSLQLAIPLMVWVLLHRQRTLGVKLWCLSSGVLGLTILLLQFRGTGADFLGYVLTSVLAIGGLALRWVALRWELGLALHVRTVAALWLGLSFGLWLAFAVNPQVWAVLTPVLLALGFVLLAQSVAALRRAWGGHSALLLALTFVLQAGVYSVVAVRWWQTGEGYPFDPASVSAAERFAVFMAFASATVVNTCYAGIMLDRSARLEVDLAVQAQRQRRVAQLSEQLAHLDRQVTLGVLSSYVVHQLDTPLEQMRRHVRSVAGLVQQRSEATELMRNFLENVVYQTREMAATVDGIKTFLQAKPVPFGPMSLPAAWQDALRLTTGLLARQRIAVVAPQLTSPPLLVWGAPAHVTQVLVGMLRVLLDERAATGHGAEPAELRVEVATLPGGLTWRVWMVNTLPLGRETGRLTEPATADDAGSTGMTREALLPLLAPLQAELKPCAPWAPNGRPGLCLEIPLAVSDAATPNEVPHD